MLTIQILTKSNEKTIKATLESVAGLNGQVVVGDLGSTDGTIDLCLNMGAKIVKLGDVPRNEARNSLIEKYGSDKNMWLHPWEAIAQGHGEIRKWNGKCLNVGILQGKSLSYDVRMWSGKHHFINPIYERLDINDAQTSPVTIYSMGSVDFNDASKWIDWWKDNKPLSPEPYNYQAYILLANSKYEEFIKIAEHYLFMEKETSISTIMMRYYYAMVQLVHRKSYKPALQNLNLCMCAKPLMAEFWCLTGDVYYHLLHKFDQAKEFYENAIIMGSRRKFDAWPMDINKYSAYPKKMIDSCEKLMAVSIYGRVK
jgi:glycosyltransferase involved in cell wall biosynthesis